MRFGVNPMRSSLHGLMARQAKGASKVCLRGRIDYKGAINVKRTTIIRALVLGRSPMLETTSWRRLSARVCVLMRDSSGFHCVQKNT